MKKRFLAAAVLLLLLSGCNGQTGKASAETDFLQEAKRLIQIAPDVIWLYHDEIKVDNSEPPYIGLGEMPYYPVVGYGSLAALQTYTRTVFTEDFCQNALYEKALDPQKPKFIEYRGKLWETRTVGGKGWIESLVPNTEELVVLTGDRGVVSAYSQSLLGTVSRQEFVFYKEKDGWRLDNYYTMNQAQEVAKNPAITALLAELGAVGKPTAMGIDTPTKTNIAVDDPVYYQPFVAVLDALEYTPESQRTVAEIPADRLPEKGSLRFSFVYGNGEYQVLLAPDGSVYLSLPDGGITAVSLTHPSGWTLLNDLANAVQWEQKRTQW